MGRKSLRKRLKNDLVYGGVRGAVAFFRALPRAMAFRLGSVLGSLASRVARKEYLLAVEHLTIAFGGEKSPREIRRLARRVFRIMARNFVETVRLGAMTPEEMDAVCILHGGENLDALRNGGIVLTAHAGCWEMLGALLVRRGIPLAVVAKRLYDPRLEEELLRSRVHCGFHVISRGENTRDIVHVIRERKALVILIDQDTKVKGIFVDFFGRPAHTATSPAHLSLKYGIPIVPVFAWRDDRDMNHVCAGTPISIEETEDRDRDVAELTVRCSRAIEAFIREHPEQWVWFHRRWKTRPGGER